MSGNPDIIPELQGKIIILQTSRHRIEGVFTGKLLDFRYTALERKGL